MIRVNTKLLFAVIIRVLISLSLIAITLYITGRVADAGVYVNGSPWQTSGNTEFAISIFKLLLSPTYGNIISSIILLTTISSILIFILLKKYINNRNYIDFYLIIYLPSLLLYANTPSKEFLFFCAGLLYVILESEYLIKNKKTKYTLLIYIIKLLLLWFMFKLRGTLSLPYLALGTITFFFKTFNLNILKVSNLKVTNICIYSFLICFFIIILTNYDFIYNIANRLNSDFNTVSILSRKFDIQLVKDIYNPFNLIKVQFLSFFPSIKETLIKPYALLIAYESLIILYLFYKSWQNLFSLIKKDNQAKLIFSLVFTSIVISYFLIYGFLGYMNIGSSQRFKTNLVPITLIFPLISEQLIRKRINKLDYYS